jgi:hypothetical protein
MRLIVGFALKHPPSSGRAIFPHEIATVVMHGLPQTRVNAPVPRNAAQSNTRINP